MKLRRQPIIATAAVVVVAGIALAIGHASKKDKTEAAEVMTAPAEKPLNISIMLDLSDRLVMKGPNDKTPQYEKDTSLIAYVRQWFIDRQVKKKFMSGDRIRVFCYPNPDLSGIAKYQDSLTVDLSMGEGKKLEAIKNNKKKLLAMPAEWYRAIDKIYSSSITGKQWPGSDVWGYFDRAAKAQCIKRGYRNILIILTDGYLYHKSTWQKTAVGEYTGISSVTVEQQKAITPIQTDMSGLEVLFLEVNPKKPPHFGKMRSLLTEWCKGMGMEHVEVVMTDLAKNNQEIVVDFLNE